MKWKHCRKGIIDGKIIAEHDDFVTIELSNDVSIGHGDPFCGTGFRQIKANPGDHIRVRKEFLTEIKENEANNGS